MSDNRIDYIEFPGTDLPATRAFYETAFGWKFEDYGPEYTSFQDGRLAGGFAAGSSAKPLVVIYSGNLEAAEQKVRAAGARIVREIFSFPGGRRFHFTDPSGNELAVWSDK